MNASAEKTFALLSSELNSSRIRALHELLNSFGKLQLLINVFIKFLTELRVRYWDRNLKFA